MATEIDNRAICVCVCVRIACVGRAAQRGDTCTCDSLMDYKGTLLYTLALHISMYRYVCL